MIKRNLHKKNSSTPSSPVSITITAQHPLSKEKYRCYPCQNFIISGGCPYHERCTFLHDPRLISKREVKRISTSSSQNIIHNNSNHNDTFYWPDVSSNGDSYELPDRLAFDIKSQHNCGMFSMCKLLVCMIYRYIPYHPF